MQRFGRAFGMGWNAFMTAFLYFSLLTALVLGGADLGLRWMGVAYLAPAAIYLGALLRRAVRHAPSRAVGTVPGVSAELRPALS